MSNLPLDTQPMIWRLTWRSPDGDKPVELIMSLTSVVDGVWTGEVRLTGYPGPVTAFPVQACDWIQAHQMMGMWARILATSFLRSGPLYWAGTDILFDVPAWRNRGPSLRDRLRAWLAMGLAGRRRS